MFSRKCCAVHTRQHLTHASNRHTHTLSTLVDARTHTEHLPHAHSQKCTRTEMLDRAHRTSFGIAAICIAAGLALAKVVLGGVEKTVGWWVVFCMYVCLFKAFGA